MNQDAMDSTGSSLEAVVHQEAVLGAMATASSPEATPSLEDGPVQGGSNPVTQELHQSPPNHIDRVMQGADKRKVERILRSLVFRASPTVLSVTFHAIILTILAFQTLNIRDGLRGGAGAGGSGMGEAPEFVVSVRSDEAPVLTIPPAPPSKKKSAGAGEAKGDQGGGGANEGPRRKSPE